MTFNRYYQDELTYLRELGAEFTKQNPELAPYLSAESKDPDVERLIEAFAFLTGRLREKLDDGLPEIVHGLLGLLWPQALRPIPCTTTMAFEPIKGIATGTEVIPQGTQLRSKTVEGTSCAFRTCYDVKLQPLTVASAEIEEVSGRSILRIAIAPIGEVVPDQLDLSNLRFFLNFDRDAAAGWELRLLLRRHIRSIRIATDGGNSYSLPAASIRAVGFEPSEAVLTAANNSFDSFRLMQEFLNVPQKFSYFDLGNLPTPGSFAGAPFVIVIEFDRTLTNLTRLGPDHIKLNCTPAINMFEADGEPITLSHRLTEYRLLPADAEHTTLIDVVQVTGWQRGRAERVVYDKFESFHRNAQTENGCFRVRLRPGLTRRNYEHYVSFVDRREEPLQNTAELALARALCCNGTLPELLGIGDIDRPGYNAPVSATFRNISQVTPFVSPPLDDMRLWSIVSIMARNYYPVSHVEGLRNLLSHLNFRAFQDRRAATRQELLGTALQRVNTRPIDVLVKGHPLRGRRITIDVDEDGMEGLGRAFLFGEVMDNFLGLFANVNACHRLELQCSRSNMLYDWPTRTGSTLPL
jgi:type VI secretion system protein ImpG